jgi:hypothetical protein
MRGVIFIPVISIITEILTKSGRNAIGTQN